MPTTTAFIAIAGRANVGKSSLLNALIGEKIAIISDKPQTTRTRITGVLTKGEMQLVFIDTPGLHKAKSKLSHAMLSSVRESVLGVDVVLFMIDCTRKIIDQEERMLDSFKSKKTPVILILNKIDLLQDKSILAERILDMSEKFSPDAIIPISVLKNDGVDSVFAEVQKYAKDSVHFFPSDTLTDRSERYLAAEMLREKMLVLLEDEVPHGIAVEIEEFSEREDKDILDISTVIYCERNSHKGIIIGKNGSMLKKIATLARNDLEDFFRIKVNLKCFVKVREDWRNKDGVIRSLGLAGE